MRAVSVKRARVNRERRQAELDLYDQAPFCARCGASGVELHGHELAGRGRGSDPARPDVLLCNPCNVWCEDNPAEAEREGWKQPSASLRHDYTPDEDGYYCRLCNLPPINWRHRKSA